MASTLLPFTLTRATADDLEEIVQLMYDSFSRTTRQCLMGCLSPSDIPKLVAKYKEIMASDASDIWIKLEDSVTGKIVAGSNWKLHVNGDPGYDEIPDWLESDAREKSIALLEPMNEERAREMKGRAFLHLHLCFTSKKYRRRGAGAMMIKWGCDLADSLWVSVWIEANTVGSKLYETFGFYLTGNRLVIDGKEQAAYMKRDNEITPIVGGRAPALSTT